MKSHGSILLALMLGMGLSACGGSQKEKSEPTTPPAATSATSATTAPAAPTAPDASKTSTAPATSAAPASDKKPKYGPESLYNPKVGQCPVTGEEIDPGVVAEIDGKMYGFCCEKCIAEFKANPAKFLSGKTEPHP